ncbi:hypothetical protein C8J57DRAFT_1590312 [Mycena rebaudengoi]|nr:hypothetical protein C8J57DRAFT_1590312 [Mycena rebaudengoi]
MPLLTRQQTFGSVHSWWSDRNPNLRGPTINLHAAAKPLMKFLYDRQALDFIRNNRGIPLSAIGWDIYGSYLSCEYVSASMKSAILDDILRRADFECEALVVDSNMLHNLIQLLQVPVTDMISYNIRRIFGTLANREASAAATCGSLAAVLVDSDVPQARVLEEVLSILAWTSCIKFPPATSGVSVEAKLLDRLLDMLGDSCTAELHQLYIFEIISDLALHESTAIAVVEANTLNTVEKLLRSHRAGLYEDIFPILENLACYESTAMAVVRILPLDLLGTHWRKSFEDTAPIDVLASRVEVLVTTKLLSAQHKATAEATSGSLVAIFCDSDIPQVVDGTLWLLSRAPHINFPPVTTGVSVEAKLLDHIVDMLKASNMAKWHYLVIFQILSHLAFHNESNAIAVVEANVLTSVEKLLRSRPTELYRHIFPMLVSIASHESTATAVLNMRLYNLLATLWQYVSYPFSIIPEFFNVIQWRDGAEGVVATKALDNVLNGLHSLDHWIQLSTCRLLRALVGHESTVQAVVAIVPREDISALALRLSKWDNDIRECAVATLQKLDATLEIIDGNWHHPAGTHIKFPPVTSGASQEAKLLDHLSDILEDADASTPKRHYRWIIKIIWPSSEFSPSTCLGRACVNMAADPHQATAEATCGSLVALVCDSDMPQVVDGALCAKLLDHIVNMLEAPNIAKWCYLVIFQILSHLALHEAGAVAIGEASVLTLSEKSQKHRSG